LACGALVFLQVVIAATGNYAFFNLLAIALCVLLLDDEAFPPRWRRRPPAALPQRRRWPRVIVALAAAVILLVSGAQTIAMLFRPRSFPAPVIAVARSIAPFQIVNTYGLFAVMTTSRPEISVEGSDDGQTWRPYVFRWKPGDPARRPRFVAPHQPRLDWQMWFAALGECRNSPWLYGLFQRLLEGSPPVLGLLAEDPFPERPPRYVRALVYDYRFTSPEERARTGRWWRRGEPRPFCPPMSLE
jgi:hypothetical protein